MTSVGNFLPSVPIIFFYKIIIFFGWMNSIYYAKPLYNVMPNVFLLEPTVQLRFSITALHVMDLVLQFLNGIFYIRLTFVLYTVSKSRIKILIISLSTHQTSRCGTRVSSKEVQAIVRPALGTSFPNIVNLCYAGFISRCFPSPLDRYYYKTCT